MRSFINLLKVVLVGFLAVKTFLLLTELYVFFAPAFIKLQHPRNKRELYTHAYQWSFFVTGALLILCTYLLIGERKRKSDE